MTVGTTTSTVTLLGNGATTVFNFSFIGDQPSTLYVSYTSPQGIITVLNPSTYTLAITPAIPPALWGIGGTVTYPNTGSPPVPIPVGSYLTITRDVPYTQNVSISNQGAFYPQSVEQALDILELQIQQIETAQTYSIQTPISDPTPPAVLPPAALRVGGILGFDNNGQPEIVFQNNPNVAPVQATPRRVNNASTTTIGMFTTDAYGGISIYQSGSAVTSVQLPASGGPYPVFDGGLNANTFPITVLPPAGELILGQSSFVMNFQGQSATFYNDGTQILIG